MATVAARVCGSIGTPKTRRFRSRSCSGKRGAPASHGDGGTAAVPNTVAHQAAQRPLSQVPRYRREGPAAASVSGPWFARSSPNMWETADVQIELPHYDVRREFTARDPLAVFLQWCALCLALCSVPGVAEMRLAPCWAAGGTRGCLAPAVRLPA